MANALGLIINGKIRAIMLGREEWVYNVMVMNYLFRVSVLRWGSKHREA